MFGRPREKCAGQLATLDAIVFFSAAILVSSTLLAYATPQGDAGFTELDIDPASLLEVLLRASIGEEIHVSVGGLAQIRGNDEIGECLMAEVHALREGVDPLAFVDLNRVVGRIMASVCGPCVNPYLVVLEKEDNCVVLAVPYAVVDARDAFASSIDLVDIDGSKCIVELVLLPTAPSELA